jgi:hypothetical protein
MFNRNGYVMRTAYPRGYAGETVDAREMLVLFVRELWMKSFVRPYVESAIQGFKNAFLVAAWLVFNLACLIGLGAVYTYDDDPAKWVEVPFKGLHRALPAFWIFVGMLFMALLGAYPMILFIHGLGQGDISLMSLLFGVCLPFVVLDKFYRPRQRVRLMRRLKGYSPPLVRHLKSPWFRRKKADLKAHLQVKVVD